MCYCISYIYLYAIYTYILPIFQMCIQISLKKRHVSINVDYIYILCNQNLYTDTYVCYTNPNFRAQPVQNTLDLRGKNMQWNYVFQPLTCNVQRILAICSNFVFCGLRCVYLFVIGIDFPIPNPIPINSLRNLRDLKTLVGGLFFLIIFPLILGIIVPTDSYFSEG